MTELTELERQLRKNVAATKATASNATDWADAVEAVSAYLKARLELEDFLKEQQGNAADAAYDTLRRSVLGRDYKLEQDK